MPSTDPPLPSGVPFTADAADRWRAARTAHRWDSRWLVLLPLGLCLFAMVRAGLPAVCSPVQPCEQNWAEDLVAVALLAEALVLLARPRGQVLVPYALLPMVWYLPEGLPDGPSRWVVLLGQVLLAWLLTVVEAGRRRARQQLVDLMGPEAPYPWTAAGGPSPFAADLVRPTGRRVLGWLLLGTAVLLLGLGLYRQAVSDERAAGAQLVQGTVLSSDDAGDTTLRYRLPDEAADRSAELDVWWDVTPQQGDTLPLLADQDGWVRLAGDPYDPTVWVMAATLTGGAGLIALASAARAVRLRRGFDRPGAPALRVLAHPTESDELVGPLSGAPLWKLSTQEIRSRQDEAGAPDHVEEDEEEEFAYPADPMEALLYQGPDGEFAQLLVRSWEADDSSDVSRPPVDWTAVVCTPDVRPRGDRPSALAPPATAPTTPIPAGPVQAVRWSMPAPVRLASGPVAALLLGFAVVSRSDHGWWGGLLQPLMFGVLAFVGMVAALGWQAVVDRRGVWVATGLTCRQADWEDVSGAKAENGRVIIRIRGGGEFGFGNWVTRWLRPRGYRAEDLASAVAHAAAAEEHRPTGRAAGPLSYRQLMANRAVLAAYLLLTVVTFLNARF
ncbi:MULTISPECIES: hypothetical protein [unclassified Kitasatospora]|uniref:hypothetical protein n=1 Tax=unclassified Kitasatospora TaxID=2633591 RepID=UPI0007102F2C|nr:MULTISPECIES: hypothetical protein [unclassified Kitasatospora]KQV17562.1 hypothetical protein ASC99_25700 [Kitasatospora sp. Root107]KRB74279.1 hypothetical protein ASE03_17275 [Kitasatospora sp. Root187]